MLHRHPLTILVLGALTLACLGATAPARAVAPNYSIVGGTPAERMQVVRALNASAFPWGLVPGPVNITLEPDAVTESTPAEITIDTHLLDMGRFAWGFVQHEFAHQVDFLLLDDQTRAMFLAALGGTTWFPAPGETTPFWQLGSERFASLLSWSYWPSLDNEDDEFVDSPRSLPGLRLSAAAFRATLQQILSL